MRQRESHIVVPFPPAALDYGDEGRRSLKPAVGCVDGADRETKVMRKGDCQYEDVSWRVERSFLHCFVHQLAPPHLALCNIRTYMVDNPSSRIFCPSLEPMRLRRCCFFLRVSGRACKSPCIAMDFMKIFPPSSSVVLQNRLSRPLRDRMYS